jgi:hypothetical protein
MAKLILLPMMLLILTEGGAQHAIRIKAEENEIPQSVVGAFRKHFENAADATWAIISSSSFENDFGISGTNVGEKSTYYDAIFSSSGERHEVVYDHFGHCVGVKKPVTTAALPSPVLKTVNERGTVVSAEQVAEGLAAPSRYLVVVKNGSAEQTITVRATGELLKTN